MVGSQAQQRYGAPVLLLVKVTTPPQQPQVVTYKLQSKATFRPGRIPQHFTGRYKMRQPLPLHQKPLRSQLVLS
jgi:hypothetical protein